MKRFIKCFLSVLFVVMFAIGSTTVSASTQRYTYIIGLTVTLNVDDGEASLTGSLEARQGEVRLRLVLEKQLDNGDWIEVDSEEISDDRSTIVGFARTAEKGRYYRAVSYGEVWINGKCVEDDIVTSPRDNY